MIRNLKNLEDENLILLYRRGNEAAFATLTKRYLAEAYGFARKYVGDSDKAEDIVQDAFLKAWKSLASFDLNKKFRPWIFTIIKNTALDYLRRREDVPFSSFEKDGISVLENLIESGEDVAASLDVKNLAAKARLAVSELPDKYRKAIDLHIDSELSFNEAAKLLESSINTVKSRYRRGIFILRDKLAAENG